MIVLVLQIGENSPVGTTVFTVQASDADDGVDGEITYSLIGRYL